jgi:hypothetical protein
MLLRPASSTRQSSLASHRWVESYSAAFSAASTSTIGLKCKRLHGVQVRVVRKTFQVPDPRPSFHQHLQSCTPSACIRSCFSLHMYCTPKFLDLVHLLLSTLTSRQNCNSPLSDDHIQRISASCGYCSNLNPRNYAVRAIGRSEPGPWTG